MDAPTKPWRLNTGAAISTIRCRVFRPLVPAMCTLLGPAFRRRLAGKENRPVGLILTRLEPRSNEFRADTAEPGRHAPPVRSPRLRPLRDRFLPAPARR